MNKEELIERIEEIELILPKNSGDWTDYMCESFYITASQFVRNYVGISTEFYSQISSCSNAGTSASGRAVTTKIVLKALKDYLVLGLDLEKSENYTTKIDVINDFMLQAVKLANSKEFHPAGAAILLGAALEEFLKKLAERNHIDLSDTKSTIDPIATKLYQEKVLKRQDIKDITSWAGIRNDATHGNFEAVNDRSRVLNALEGVNLFMRKYNE
jgi:hypothetical protein